MLSFLRALTRKDAGQEATSAGPERAPSIVEARGAQPFVLADHMDTHEGFPHMRWDDVHAWLETVPEGDQDAAWEACCSGWRLHLRDALGPHYRVDESSRAVILSSLDHREAGAALEFMEKTARRILHVLKGIAEESPGRELLVIFDDQETYYRYVSRFYPEEGEFAFSGGMHIGGGASYYVTTKSGMLAIEPVIAHEMTHGFVGGLPLPLWLNEGLAVNTERRIAAVFPPLYTPQEMRAKHLKFWGAAEIQEFWSGLSFRRPDDGNMLSYDLARVLVEQLSADWPRFTAFARAAHWEDAGAAAAREHFGTGLGELASALLDQQASTAFEPDPGAWSSPADHVPASQASYLH